MSAMLICASAAYALVGFCAARWGFSLAAYSGRQWVNDYSYLRASVTSEDPRFRPNLGVGYIVGLAFGLFWPILLTTETLRRLRPWRLVRLVAWCVTPAERQWLRAQQRRQLQQTEKALGLGTEEPGA